MAYTGGQQNQWKQPNYGGSYGEHETFFNEETFKLPFALTFRLP